MSASKLRSPSAILSYRESHAYIDNYFFFFFPSQHLPPNLFKCLLRAGDLLLVRITNRCLSAHAEIVPNWTVREVLLGSFSWLWEADELWKLNFVCLSFSGVWFWFGVFCRVSLHHTHPILAMCIFYCGGKKEVINFIQNQRWSQMMLLGFLFESKVIGLYKNSAQKLVIPAAKTKLGHNPSAPTKPCALLQIYSFTSSE